MTELGMGIKVCTECGNPPRGKCKGCGNVPLCEDCWPLCADCLEGEGTRQWMTNKETTLGT